MRPRQYILLALLLTIGLCLLSSAQGPLQPLVSGPYLLPVTQGPVQPLLTGQYLRAQQINGQTRDLVGLNTSNQLSLDPGSIGSTFGGTVTIPTLSFTTLTGTITSSNLPSNLKTGYIPINLWDARLVSANAIPNLIEGAVPDGNSAPSLARVNGATDKQTRIVWASSSSTEIQLPVFGLPADFDGNTAWSVKFLAAMAGAADTPVLTVDVFRGVGDTNQGGATAGVTGTTIAAYSRGVNGDSGTLAVSPISISVTPGAHTTDALYVYAAWIEYTRKS